ncbi:hypothetical protein [Marinobacterium litorale]|uniref:hypothetical protein n=1 Tax=Marinobacterium litorale TaxID=404770 RepID=UPI00042693B7|nr:hypothetical protein [Marinobacterium litorale]
MEATNPKRAHIKRTINYGVKTNAERLEQYYRRKQFRRDYPNTHFQITVLKPED